MGRALIGFPNLPLLRLGERDSRIHHFGGEKMVKQIFGAKSAPASESAHRLPPAICIGVILGGFAVAATLTAPAAAQTFSSGPCVGTGNAAVIGGFGVVPFASGGGVNTLVSAINNANTAFVTQSTAFIGAPLDPEPYQLGGGVWARGKSARRHPTGRVGSGS